MSIFLNNPSYTGQTAYWRSNVAPHVSIAATEGTGADIGTFIVTDAQMHTAGLAAGVHSGPWRIGVAASPAGTDLTIGIEPPFRYDGTNMLAPLAIADIQTAMTNQGFTAALSAILLANLDISGPVASAASIATITGRLTPERALYLDNLNTSGLPVANAADMTTLLGRLTAARAGFLDHLNMPNGTIVADSTAVGLLTTRLTDVRAAALDTLISGVVLSAASITATRDAIVGGQVFIKGSVVDGSPAANSFIGVNTLSSVNSLYSTGKCVMTFTSGTLRGISNMITAYNGTSKKFTFATPWAVAPANGDTFVMMGRIN